jgi:hypothetical protein
MQLLALYVHNQLFRREIMPLDERNQMLVLAFIDALRKEQADSGYYPRTSKYQEAIIKFYRSLHTDNPEHVANVLRHELNIGPNSTAPADVIKAIISENVFKFARKLAKHRIQGGLLAEQALQQKEPKWSGKFADCMHAVGVRSKEGIQSAWNFVKTWAKKIADTIITKVLNAKLSVSQAIDRSKLEARAFWRDKKAEMGSGLVTTAAALTSVVERAVGAKYAPGIQGVGSNLRGLAVESSLRSRVDARERSRKDFEKMSDYHGEQRQALENKHAARKTQWGIKGTGKGRS